MVKSLNIQAVRSNRTSTIRTRSGKFSEKIKTRLRSRPKNLENKDKIAIFLNNKDNLKELKREQNTVVYG